MAPKLGALILIHDCHNFDTTNQQVHWVVQVIPYVSKGRSHRDCWYEASYGHLVNLSQANSNGYGGMRIKHKDKDRDTYVIHW